MSKAPRRNLERKAPCPDPATARAALLGLGARLASTEEQRDTFFPVPHGRLKLREIDPAGAGALAVLIWYDRPDHGSVRASAYRLCPVADADETRSTLAAALGVRGEVRKRREVWLWHNVRVHLDEVDGLGRFVEFEAVLGPGEEEPASQDRLRILAEHLGLGDEAIPVAYADLLGL